MSGENVMFGWFKRRKPVTMELDHDTIEAMFDEVDSDEEGEFDRISEHTSDVSGHFRIQLPTFIPTAISYPWHNSLSRRIPLQITIIPGGGSLLRFRYPPSLASA